MATMSVKVAVRVRPFLPREVDRKAKCCINMKGGSTSITHPETGDDRTFTFDYSFWSHDEFETTENGVFVPTSSKYADQQCVYQALGKQVLDNAWDGYHCCLFAYGQTGAGKSYSMVGYGPNKGIVPIACDEIFKRISAEKNPNTKYEITVSMLEIYNERTQDLLIDPTKRPKGGLEVRESKTVGVFVKGLSKHPVQSYEHIERKMEEGNRNRTIGSTLMNATSSRAHTIIALEFKQIEVDGNRKKEKFSVINLVDLAGSEKAGQTGATGDRLKEGCAINKSLTVLGQCISILADKAMGKAAKTVVPYRDSALTRILQNALGGNSKTIMICALSPATTNYEETLSTLRYADRAKKIKNKAIINESPQEKLIRELKTENDQLKKMLAEISKAADKGLPPPKALLKDIKDLQGEMETNEEALKEMEVPWEQKVEEEKQKAEEDELARRSSTVEDCGLTPHLTNMHEDPQLNRRIQYSLTKQKQTLVGRKNGNPEPHIILGGLGIKPNHAVFSVDGEFITLAAWMPECAEQISVNGDNIPPEKPVVLKHNDRIIFGHNVVFLFQNPGKESEAEDLGIDKEIDYDFAQQERMEKSVMVSKTQDTMATTAVLQEDGEIEVSKQMEGGFNSSSDSDIAQALASEEQQAVFQEQLIKAQEEAQQKHEEELRQREAFAQEKHEEQTKQLFDKIKELEAHLHQAENKKREQDTVKTNDKIKQFMPTVREANLIAKELGRKVKFTARLMNILPDDIRNPQLLGLQQKTDIFVAVNNVEEGYEYTWSRNKFQDRLDIMRDIMNVFYEDGEVEQLDRENDPFWDPPEHQRIGKAYYILKPLAHMIDNPVNIKIIGDEEEECGKLEVNIRPVDEDGESEPPEEILPEEPEDMLGEKINFRVDIMAAKELPPHFCKDVYVEYSFYREEEKHVTIVSPGKNRNPFFNFSELHRDCVITDQLLDYLLKSTLCFKVYGLRDQKVKRKKQAIKREKEPFEVAQVKDEKPRKAAVADETPPIIHYGMEHQRSEQNHSPKHHVSDKSLQMAATGRDKRAKSFAQGLHKSKKDKKDCAIF